MKKITLKAVTEYQKKQCELFSEYSVNSSVSHYKNRNQGDKEKIVKDIYNGKVAEFMVYNTLKKIKPEITLPDLVIYESRNKSYDADMIVGDSKIHVKSHEVNEYYPVSWMFQKNDPLVICESENDYLSLVVMSEKYNYMYFISRMNVSFQEPMKESLKNNKVCIYENSLFILK